MSAADRSAWLAFRPRDTVFVRDGRPFDAVVSHTATSVGPWPSTVAGATRAAYGHEPDEVRGPVLAHQPSSSVGWSAFFPVPADVVAETASETGTTPYVFRLACVDVGGETDLGGPGFLRWLVPPAGAAGKKVERVDGWLSGRWLTSYLAGGAPPARGVSLESLGVQKPVYAEQRIGLALEPTARTARSGYFYQARHQRLQENWAYLAECRLPDSWARTAAGPVHFGGRSRLVDVESAAGVEWPARPDHFPGGRVLVYVATPAIWPDGWRIPVPPHARLVAAATGRPQPVATTSPRHGWRSSRALRWAVSAGSVYLLQFDGDVSAGGAAEARARRWAASVHASAYLPGADGQAEAGPAASVVDVLEGDRIRTAGFGVVLTGVWT